MKKLFGNNIKPNCEYCRLAKFDYEGFICTKNKKIVDEKCKKFQYDPLKRVPNPAPALKQYSIDDFVL